MRWSRSYDVLPLTRELRHSRWKLRHDGAGEQPIIEQLNGAAEGNLKECGNSEQLASAYGIGARQLRRWMRAYIEGGIDGLLFIHSEMSLADARRFGKTANTEAFDGSRAPIQFDPVR